MFTLQIFLNALIDNMNVTSPQQVWVWLS